jgi:protein-tyrosine phosphatase
MLALVVSARARRSLIPRHTEMIDGFVDIHCHLLPGIDDGAKDWDESLAMARLAIDNGTKTIIATPHQLGSYGQNHAMVIRQLVGDLQQRLAEADLSLRILPGADVRIEEDLVSRLKSGDVLTLGDHGRHVLLEMPHELLLPLEPILDQLARWGIVGIITHPERNVGLVRRPQALVPLVDAGCLTQITAGSLCGAFGPYCQQAAEWMLAEGLVHFVATDGHGPHSRRPLMRRAYERVVELADEQTADELCGHNPALVAGGNALPTGRRKGPLRQRAWWRRKSAARANWSSP